MKHIFKMTERKSKVILYTNICIFLLGASAADSLADNGKMWLLMLMLFVPFGVGFIMDKKGWLEWMKKDYID